MFVKSKEATFASALNLNNFHTIEIRRHREGYELIASIEGASSVKTIAIFSDVDQAKFVFNDLMQAIAGGKRYWSVD